MPFFKNGLENLYSTGGWRSNLTGVLDLHIPSDCSVVPLQDMRIRPRLRQERWQVTCGLVLIYTLVNHVASNGGTSHVPGNSKVTPSVEKVINIYNISNLNLKLI